MQQNACLHENFSANVQKIKIDKKVGVENSIETKNWFAKSSGIKKNNNNGYDRVDEDSHDRYNALDIIKDGTRGTEHPYLNSSNQQSKDLIYFYFFDLINDK